MDFESEIGFTDAATLGEDDWLHAHICDGGLHPESDRIPLETVAHPSCRKEEQDHDFSLFATVSG